MNIGLIADDSKKTLMQNFCIAYRSILSKHRLYATGTTGRLIEEDAALTVNKYLEGALGGERQMASQIENNDMDLMFYFRDPDSKRPAAINLQKVIYLCDAYNIPLATNISTAELLIRSLDQGDIEWREAYHS